MLSPKKEPALHPEVEAALKMQGCTRRAMELERLAINNDNPDFHKESYRLQCAATNECHAIKARLQKSHPDQGTVAEVNQCMKRSFEYAMERKRIIFMGCKMRMTWLRERSRALLRGLPIELRKAAVDFTVDIDPKRHGAIAERTERLRSMMISFHKLRERVQEQLEVYNREAALYRQRYGEASEASER